MPFYTCTECLSTVSISPEITRRKRQNCKFCGGRIDSGDLDADATQEVNLADEPPPEKKTRAVAPSAPGRMQAAPPQGSWPLAQMNSRVKYFKDATTWTDTPTRIRLAYEALDVSDPNLQGIAIDLPALAQDPEAQKHFRAVTAQLEARHNSPMVTEATGEAAAAMAVLEKYPGFVMRWGMHCHTGPGIDQIWISPGTGALAEVLIVEAKGPNAGLNPNAYMPPDFEQLSMNWIFHNLASMMNSVQGKVDAASAHQGTLAKSIVDGMGATVGNTYPNYGGGSKSYYGVISAAPARIKMRRVCITAGWAGDGLLTYAVREFAPVAVRVAPAKFLDDMAAKYPRDVVKPAKNITYP